MRSSLKCVPPGGSPSRVGRVSMRPGLVYLSVVAVLLGVLFAFPGKASALAPGNDAFAEAQALSGETGDVFLTNLDATKEIGEPNHAGNAGGASVWFHWTAQRSGTLTVWTYQPTFDTLLAVYTGSSVDTLSAVASNDNYGGGTTSRVTFPVVSGTDYQIAVDGAAGASGTFRLRWRQGPENDNFADAQVIAGLSGGVNGSVYGATAEPGEILDFSAASVWYRWTAPEDGLYCFVPDGARPGATVYTGASLNALVVAAGPSQGNIFLSATGGTEYYVRFAGRNWNDTNDTQLRWGKAPVNDDFAGALTIDGGRGSLIGSNACGTVETNEPGVGSYGSTVWYGWTAPATGHVRFDTWMAPDALWAFSWDSVLTVYTGPSVDSLTRVARNDDWWYTAFPGGEFGSALSFHAVAGTTYWISVAAHDYGPMSWGSFGLRWYPGRIVLGKKSNETIVGTPGRDYLAGRDGNDVIRGMGGVDILVGGEGADQLYGGSGADLLVSRDGKKGNDVIYGGPGKDTARADRHDVIHQVP
jgi:Ca2+-binding RTX toxin-like protein